MDIKKGLDLQTSNFWYDLVYGKYIVPEDILINERDIIRVKQAISILQEFERSCEKAIPDFII